ncbi:MAG: DUF4157 domain-containing protein [Spirochaetales bacterium]|nr:DUF4157 domain-containing protein [Spirochaetales bacterium]
MAQKTQTMIHADNDTNSPTLTKNNPGPVRQISPVHASIDTLPALEASHNSLQMQRLLASHAIQAKLKIGRPGDIYEMEADRIAEQVMRMPDLVCPTCVKDKEEFVQRKESSSEQSPPQDTGGDLQARINNIRGRGVPLAGPSRRFFEPRFGRDFGDVRVHTGNYANETAGTLRARAFTIGHDIVFGSGEYSPGTERGRRLLGHELVHVMQQGGMDSVIQCDDPPVMNRPHQPPIRQGRLPSLRIGGRRGSSTGGEQSDLLPMPEYQRDNLTRAIEGTNLYALILRREEMLNQIIEILPNEWNYTMPEVGVPDEYNHEQNEISERVERLDRQIETLNERIANELDNLLAEDIFPPNTTEDEFIEFITHRFPDLFKERAREIAIFELNQNKLIVEEEARRYYGIRYDDLGRPIESDLNALRNAARDLVNREREIHEERIRLNETSTNTRPINRQIVNLMNEYSRLENEYRLRFPILMRVSPSVICSSNNNIELIEILGGELNRILNDIYITKQNILNNSLQVMNLPPIIERTKENLGIASNQVLCRVIDNHFREERSAANIRKIALAALAITVGIAGAILTGGSSLIAVAGTLTSRGILGLAAAGTGLTISGYQLSESVSDYLIESAASNVAIDPRLADISRNDPELLSIVLDIVGIVFDVGDVVQVFRALRVSRNIIESLNDIDIHQIRRVFRGEQITEDLTPNVRRLLADNDEAFLMSTRNVDSPNLDILDAHRELDLARRTGSSTIPDDPEFIEEIVFNGHRWRRHRISGGWCRFSDPLCYLFGANADEGEIYEFDELEHLQELIGSSFSGIYPRIESPVLTNPTHLQHVRVGRDMEELRYFSPSIDEPPVGLDDIQNRIWQRYCIYYEEKFDAIERGEVIDPPHHWFSYLSFRYPLERGLHRFQQSVGSKLEWAYGSENVFTEVVIDPMRGFHRDTIFFRYNMATDEMAFNPSAYEYRKIDHIVLSRRENGSLGFSIFSDKSYISDNRDRVDIIRNLNQHIDELKNIHGRNFYIRPTDRLRNVIPEMDPNFGIPVEADDVDRLVLVYDANGAYRGMNANIEEEVARDEMVSIAEEQGVELVFEY